MSNLPESDVNYQNALQIRPKYKYDCTDFSGTILISGIKFPENPVFSVLGKIWSSVRKRIEERYGVSVTCLFVADSEREVVSGNFLLNCAICEDDHAAREKYNIKFKKTFPLWVGLFEDAIDAFLLDRENGYTAYCEYVESCEDGKIDTKVCDDMLNRFLFSVNLKTEKDEKKKRRLKEAVPSKPPRK